MSKRSSLLRSQSRPRNRSVWRPHVARRTPPLTYFFRMSPTVQETMMTLSHQPWHKRCRTPHARHQTARLPSRQPTRRCLMHHSVARRPGRRTRALLSRRNRQGRARRSSHMLSHPRRSLPLRRRVVRAKHGPQRRLRNGRPKWASSRPRQLQHRRVRTPPLPRQHLRPRQAQMGSRRERSLRSCRRAL